MDIQIEIFTPKVNAAWTALQRQYAGRITGAELDHLYACFVFGLTSPCYAASEPSAHFDICRALLGRELSPERVHTALHSVPEPTQPWVERAFGTIEQQGAKIGLVLAEQMHIGEGRSDAH